ncbi:uncharacterized protein M6B38_267040 [Iris pallida]|uniref:Uncharacterized protein n=1 Tax=Iris pallida TaxID=29817 RepID=A0AAX6I980_IRIPA|nr:uncharacterized protein M6B38_267040 [Iris pallida]
MVKNLERVVLWIMSLVLRIASLREKVTWRKQSQNCLI